MMHTEWVIREPRPLSERSQQRPRDYHDRFGCTEDLTKAERFENFRNRAIHASPIAFSMPARSELRHHRLGNRDAAEQGTFGLGDPAADQFSNDRPGFQIGVLGSELAVLVGETAGGEIV